MILKPQPAQELFLSSPADICIYGGAAGGGKSWSLLFQPLRHIHHSDFECVIFRKTYPEITNPGGLWDESQEIYPLRGLDAQPRLKDMSWSFPTGARVSFGHMQHESDKFKWQGSQIALIEFDELTHFSESSFFYMLSRNRSKCGVNPYIRATCNPNAASWVADFIGWWIGEDGHPIPERAGKLRWFVRDHGNLLWADSPEELQGHSFTPRSVTFIPASVTDNQALLEKNPEYLSNLQALPEVERERLLGGNWKIQDDAGCEWPQEYFVDIWSNRWPDRFDVSAITVDPSKGRETGDYSAIVFVGVSGGIIWVDADIARRPPESIVCDAIDMQDELHPDYFGLESNAWQDLMAPLFDLECQDRNRAPVPIDLIDNRVKKEIRIRRIGRYLRDGKIKLRSGSAGCGILLRQLSGFPLADHDDGPDALEMAIRLIQMNAGGAASEDEFEVIEA